MGDVVESALSRVGITSDRVTKWLGQPCGCKERKQKLNQIDAWARRVVGGQTANARRFLAQIIGGPPDDIPVDDKDSDD